MEQFVAVFRVRSGSGSIDAVVASEETKLCVGCERGIH